VSMPSRSTSRPATSSSWSTASALSGGRAPIRLRSTGAATSCLPRPISGCPQHLLRSLLMWNTCRPCLEACRCSSSVSSAVASRVQVSSQEGWSGREPGGPVVINARLPSPWLGACTRNRCLRVVNPSPYMIYLQARGSILVASSPEILCRLGEDGKVTNRWGRQRRYGVHVRRKSSVQLQVAFARRGVPFARRRRLESTRRPQAPRAQRGVPRRPKRAGACARGLDAFPDLRDRRSRDCVTGSVESCPLGWRNRRRQTVRQTDRHEQLGTDNSSQVGACDERHARVCLV
jgi:hypothetical protein